VLFKLTDNELTVKDFIGLRKSAGWGGSPENQVEAGLNASLYTVSAICDDKVVGMGRLVGDGFMICYIQDVIVLPEFQGAGIGRAIVEKLIAYVNNNGLPNTNIAVGLFAAKGKEDFYRKLSFYARPNENRGAGMEMIIKVGHRI